MKLNSTLLYFLLFSLSARAQNITGIWKGYFVQNTFGMSEDRYRFEVQIAQMPNNELTIVTYSYKTTVFYGKAEAKGNYTKTTKDVLINELKLVDVKIDDQSSPCLMKCQLEYDKMGNIETLTGTYTSRNVRDRSDCGIGTVYLEKSPTTDFYKEDFLVKRENELKKLQKTPPKKLLGKPVLKDKEVAKKVVPKLKIIKPGAEDNLIKKSDKKEITSSATPPAPPATVTVPKKAEPNKSTAPPPPVVKTFPKPEVLKKRNNELYKTIETSAKEFKVDLYDNGEIDGDRISVYHNNELIVSNKLLTDKPISFTIKADENTSVHDFIMVAENLGSIPPNTALMVVTAGGKRYELFVTSTEQKNAMVRVEYKNE